MSTELKNGAFTPIEDLPEAVDTLNKHIKKGDAERFHVGERDALEEMFKKQGTGLAEAIEKMEKKFNQRG